MRVLVVDQDSASNLVITRSLRDLYTVDCVTNKGDCLDLLRANQFEVIVATERLEDGSGLELLGQVSKKWPSVLRIFAADRQRLQLLRGRLGPFDLFQTLSYPIDPQKLVATLEIAAATQQGESQQIDLPSEAAPEEPQETPAEEFELSEESESDDPGLELEQSDDFSEPRFARAGRAAPRQVTSEGARAPSRAAPAPRARVGSDSASGRIPSRGSADAGVSAAGASRAGGAPRARRAESLNRANDLAAKFPGSGTIGPRRSPGGGTPSGGSPSRAGASAGAGPGAGRSRSAAAKAPPVRFPPLERTPPLERAPPLERIPPLEPPIGSGREFSEAAAMARAARSNYETSAEEFDTKRLAAMIGGGVAVVAIVVVLAFKMFGSKSDAPKPTAAPVVAHAPEYPPEVTNLIAQIEASFKADDFKTARADVDKLRQLSPSHPRLDFFEGLLNSKPGGASAARGTSSKKNGKSTGTAVASSGTSASSSAAGDASHSNDTHESGPDPSGGTSHGVTHNPASSGVAASGLGSAGTSASASPGADGSPALPPETPVGFTRAPADAARASTAANTSVPAPNAPATSGAADSTSAPASAVASPGGSGASMAASGNAASASTSTHDAAPAAALANAESAHASGSASPAARRGAGEPPPVVQEAKLIRRVTPDYPSAAKKDSIAGWVDLDVTVSAQGVVGDVAVVQSTPPDMFDKSAVAAVRKWKYDPRFVDGLPSQAHLKVHLEFGPNK